MNTILRVTILTVLFSSIFTFSSIQKVEAETAKNIIGPAINMILNPATTTVVTAKGMTWTKTSVDDNLGVIDVGCGYTPGAGNQCDPYEGDTDCNAELPVLCFYDANLPKPSTLVIPNNYHEWSGGIVATTERVAGNSFASIQEANTFCVSYFGEDWRVAEHHDGSSIGWYFKAYGNVGDTWNEHYPRLWVHVSDQPNGTCW